MQGLWNAKIAQAWECCESSTRDDAHLVVHKERQLPDPHITKYMTQHTTLTNQSMGLFSLLSLNQEHLMLCHAIRLARAYQLQIHRTIFNSVLPDSRSMRSGWQRRVSGERTVRPCYR